MTFFDAKIAKSNDVFIDSKGFYRLYSAEFGLRNERSFLHLKSKELIIPLIQMNFLKYNQPKYFILTVNGFTYCKIDFNKKRVLDLKLLHTNIMKSNVSY